VTSGGSTVRIDLTYNTRGLEASETRSNNTSGSSVIGTATYTYDTADRLTNLQQTGSTAFANYTYTYDNNSDVTSETLNGGTPTSYSYDAVNELTNDSVATYTYDKNGNRTMTGYTTGPGNELTNDGTWTYTYLWSWQPQSVEKVGVHASFFALAA
jgi:YD repeat-containing protein